MKLVSCVPLLAIAFALPAHAAPQTNPTGMCQSYTPVTVADLVRPLGPGNYTFKVPAPAKFNIELAGGGGGGGGASIHSALPFQTSTSAGLGGNAGAWSYGTFPLDVGRYFIRVGVGGAGGVSGPSGGTAPSGSSGTDTVIGSCTTEKEILRARGGVGGRGDGMTTAVGGNGQSLRNQATGEILGTGGSGGNRGEDGRSGAGYGAGGGGQGGTSTPNRRGGNGSAGFARLTAS